MGGKIFSSIGILAPETNRDLASQRHVMPTQLTEVENCYLFRCRLVIFMGVKRSWKLGTMWNGVKAGKSWIFKQEVGNSLDTRQIYQPNKRSFTDIGKYV